MGLNVFIRNVCALLVLAAAGVTPARAQESGLAVGQINAGPVVGFGEIKGASISFGARFEWGMVKLADLNDAVLGAQALYDRYSYNSTSGGYHYRMTHQLFGAIANYHLPVDDTRWDPFLGVGLGHDAVSATPRDGAPAYDGGTSAGLFFVVHAGFRYFFRPRLAFSLDAGTGTSSLNVGVMLRLN